MSGTVSNDRQENQQEINKRFLTPFFSSPFSSPKTGRELSRWPVDANYVARVAVLPDQQAITGDSDGNVFVWNLATGEVAHSHKAHSGRVTALAASAKGDHVLSAGFNQTVRLWKVPTDDDKTDDLASRVRAWKMNGAD